MTTTRESTEDRPTGLTRDVGWEIGVSRTITAPLDVVWAFLTSDAGVAIWLGSDVSLPTAAGESYQTSDGTEGEIRSYHDSDRVRLRWRPADWDHETTLQIAVTGGDTKTMVRIHQEHLANGDERERMRAHWRAVLDRLSVELRTAG